MGLSSLYKQTHNLNKPYSIEKLSNGLVKDPKFREELIEYIQSKSSYQRKTSVSGHSNSSISKSNRSVTPAKNTTRVFNSSFIIPQKNNSIKSLTHSQIITKEQ